MSMIGNRVRNRQSMENYMTGSYTFPRVQVIPQIGRASLCIDGVERVGYEFGEGASRPFLVPAGRSFGRRL